MYHLNWRPVFQNFDMLWHGLLLGLGLALLSLAIGSIIGMICALARVYGNRTARSIAAGYTEFVRNIPLLLIVYFVFYGLGLMGFQLLDNVWSFVAAPVHLFRRLSRRGLQGRRDVRTQRRHRSGKGHRSDAPQNHAIYRSSAHVSDRAALAKQHIHLHVQRYIARSRDLRTRVDLWRHGDQHELLAHSRGLHYRGHYVSRYLLCAGRSAASP